MKERNVFIIKLVTSHIFLVPVILILFFLFSLPMIPAVLIPQTILVILFFTGYWEFIGRRNKWLICLADEALILITFFAGFSSFNSSQEKLVWIVIFSLIELYLLLILSRILWVILKEDKEKYEIEFPFRNGAYLITDGGNSKISRLMNYHFHSPVHKRKQTNHSMLYATDIVKMRDQVKKFLPPENTDYPIFGEDIYCPMEGRVVKVVNDVEDNIPYIGNYPYNTGNTVVLKHGRYYLLLGHLRKGSISLKPGDNVNRMDLIGKAGNSGMSERPHLHMQLMRSQGEDYWKGQGISMQFRARNLFKNRLIRN